MNCPRCGTELPDDSKFCVLCGHPVRSPQVPTWLHALGLRTRRQLALGLGVILAVVVGVVVVVGLIIAPFGDDGGEAENEVIGIGPTPTLRSSPTLSDEEPRQTTGRYVEAIVGVPARVNPVFAPLSDTDADLASLIFSGLTRLGPQGEVLPDLAESWGISDDGLNYTFKLRRDVSWHTGAAFTAEDAVFTYDLLADPELPSDPTLGQLWRQVSCNAPDEFTLLCELPEPFAPFLAYTSIGLLPKHVLEGTTAATIADSPFNQAPAGTGPYRLAQLDQTKAILRANPTYYGEKPIIDELEFRFYPDPSAAAAALSRGEVQGHLLGPGASQEDFDLLTSTPGLRAYPANGATFTYFVVEEIQGVEIGTLFDTSSRFASIAKWMIATCAASQRSLTEFIASAQAGRVESVKVDGTTICYELVGDEGAYESEMEEGDTVRQVLQDAGIAPEDFPPITVRE